MMYAYIDESRRRHRLFVGGLLLSEDSLGSLADDLKHLARQVFGSYALTEQTEFHGHPMLMGEKHFEGLPRAKRVDAFEKILELVHSQLDGDSSVSIVRVDTDAMEEWQDRFRGDRPDLVVEEYAWTLRLLLIEFFRKAHRAFVIADDDQWAVKVTLSYLAYLREKEETAGRPMLDWDQSITIDSLVDLVHFTKSTNSRVLQAADVVLYLAQRYHHVEMFYPDGPRGWELPLWRAWRAFAEKSQRPCSQVARGL